MLEYEVTTKRKGSDRGETETLKVSIEDSGNPVQNNGGAIKAALSIYTTEVRDTREVVLVRKV